MISIIIKVLPPAGKMALSSPSGLPAVSQKKNFPDQACSCLVDQHGCILSSFIFASPWNPAPRLSP